MTGPKIVWREVPHWVLAGLTLAAFVVALGGLL